jgi:hypothetical protein
VAAPARLRMSRTSLLPVVLLAVCLLALASLSNWTLLLLLIPAVIAAWVVRVGVDVDEAGLTVRSLAGQRRVSWDELAGIRVAPGGRLRLVTTAGTEIRLPVMRARDLPQVSALSGGRIDVPQPPS